MGYEVDYGFSPKKNLYFVYLIYTENFREALNELRVHRKIEEFDDCWVYVMGVYDRTKTNKTVAKTEEQTQKTTTEEKGDTQQTEGSGGESKTDAQGNDKKGTGTDKDTEQEKAISESGGASSNNLGKINLLSSKIFLNAFHGRNLIPINTDIQVIDLERSKLNGAVKANEVIRLRDPNNGTGELVLNL